MKPFCANFCDWSWPFSDKFPFFAETIISIISVQLFLFLFFNVGSLEKGSKLNFNDKILCLQVQDLFVSLTQLFYSHALAHTSTHTHTHTHSHPGIHTQVLWIDGFSHSLLFFSHVLITKKENLFCSHSFTFRLLVLPLCFALEMRNHNFVMCEFKGEGWERARERVREWERGNIFVSRFYTHEQVLVTQEEFLFLIH